MIDFFGLYEDYIGLEHSYKEICTYLDFLSILHDIINYPDICSFQSAHLFEIYGSIVNFLRKKQYITLNQSIIAVENGDLKKVFYNHTQLSSEKIEEKIIDTLNLGGYITQDADFLHKISLIRNLDPNFQLKLKYHQYPCSIHTTIQRSKLIHQNLIFNSLPEKILFIGDDDLVSIVLKIIAPEIDVYVVEIDENLTELLEILSKRFELQNYHIINGDIESISSSDPLLPIEPNNFSIISTDPPYEPDLLEMFLEKVKTLGHEKILRIQLNGNFNFKCMQILQEFISKNSLKLSNVDPQFNTYPLNSLNPNYLDKFHSDLIKHFQIDIEIDKIKTISTKSYLYFLEKRFTCSD